MFQLSPFLRLTTLDVFFFSVCTLPDRLTWYPATPTFSISFMINLDGLSEVSSSAFLLQACLIFCLSIVLGLGSVWLWSSLPSRIFKSSRSVLQRQAHVFSTHLHSLEFLNILSFRNLYPSMISPGFPRLVTNFSMLAMLLNEQIYQVT